VGSPDHQTIVILLAFALFCALFLILGLLIGARYGKKRAAADWERRLPAVIKARLRQSRAVIGGLVSEQMAPLLPGFPFDPGDCRFVGRPVDFIVFKGMNEKDISEVVFLEVKSGAGRNLNEQEKRLREVIRAGRVRWEELDLP
jgi:predicted Holliday junction resolvase-like endonuclease